MPFAPTELSARPELWIALYRKMLLIRHFELAAQREYKTGKMPGFIHLYVGEEAVATGVCAHLADRDWITSTHRGHGHALAKGVSPRVVMAELFGKETGCCGGRGGSMHLYDAAVGLFGTNGFVGGGIPSAAGAALSARLRGTKNVAAAFFGDGAVNHGAFHESVNFAAVQGLPVVFICENNLYATATPLTMATRNTAIASRAEAYGIPGVSVDGNDLPAVWEAARHAVDRARAGEGPTLIEARTYRVVGHHEGDPIAGTYRTMEELDEWKERCPIKRFRALLEGMTASAEELDALEQEVLAEVNDAVAFAHSSRLPDPTSAEEHVWARPLHPPLPTSQIGEGQQQSWLDAVRDGIAEEMRRGPHLIYLGEGIGERGGSFAHTKGLWAEFGGARVIDTPISELGFTGAAIGAAATGCRAVADLMFADFLFEAASQIVQQAAKLRYMSNGQMDVPLVIRAGMGAIKNAGPHHSGCYHPIWAHCPGLIVVVPSSPADAKGLMKTALRARDPVIFLEHKLLFGSKGIVPKGDHLVPFGQANTVRAGTDLTIVACGEMVHRTLQAAARLTEMDQISCEVIDLRTIVPLDTQTIRSSVEKTGRLLIVDEGFSMCGLGAEISATIAETAFDDLDAPPGRLHISPVAQPFSPALEDAIIVTVDKIVAAAREVIAGTPPGQKRLCVNVKPAAPHRIQPNPKSDSTAAPPAPAGIPIMLPNQDLTVTEATVLRWLKKIGDELRAGESLVEVETAKSVFHVEAPTRGILAGINAREGSIVAMTEPLGRIQPS